VIGARIIDRLRRDAPSALAIVRSHHERIDGKGFPEGLRGDAIPFEVRVVTVADSFDAMTSVRPYRPALSVQMAMQELEDMQGVQFDPGAVAAFLAAFPDRAALPVTTLEARPLHLPARPLEAPAADARSIEAPAAACCVAPMTDTLMVGVSGVRGIVGKDLTDEVVMRYARAFGMWAAEHAPLVVVGRDARTSGPAFERAVTAGLGSVGCDVVTVGLAPTPTIQLAVEHHAAGGGIAITASHNPIEW